MMITTKRDLVLLDRAERVNGFREDVLRGLRRSPKRLPCQYLYDDEGSRLFEEICSLPEYYLTRTEIGILRRRREEIAARCGPACVLVEFGSGSSTKTRLLLDQLDRPAAYVPIDIAQDQLDRATLNLRASYPALEVLPVCADYFAPITLPAPERTPGGTLFFFPGSTIGNLEPLEAAEFLCRLRSAAADGDALLIGVDLLKARAILEPAYDDARGVTAAFNLNLLRRMNRELNANFNLERFRHRAVLNDSRRRIEMHLVSLQSQRVRVDGEPFRIERGEPIITEHSYKYSESEFGGLAREAGWSRQQCWSDAAGKFAVFFLE